MRSFLKLALAAALTLTSQVLAAPVVKVTPGNVGDLVITQDDTVNATKPAPANATLTNGTSGPVDNSTSTTASVSKPVKIEVEQFDAVSNNGNLPLALVNNFAGAINAYVTGLDVDNRLVMLQPDGTWFYPSSDASQTTPVAITAQVALPLGAQGSTTTYTMPGYISAARVWFAAGDLHFFTVWNPATNGPSLVEPSAVNPSDPSAAVNWGFVELTNTEAGGLYANISYVDFVGLVLGMKLLAGDGTTQTAEGLKADSVASICAALKAQTAADGQPWSDLCQVDANGTPLRIIAPSDYVSTNPDAFSTYFNDYIDAVWELYTNNDLTINTQAAAGDVACRVSGDLLTCAGDNRGYAKPTAGDIFGCNSGPFAIEAGDNDVHYAAVPRLCAAFHRTTFTLSGGNVQPALSSSNYYVNLPTNHYAALVHQNEVDGRGYAFSYDDVNPDGENQSGVVAAANPQVLTVIVGGPSS